MLDPKLFFCISIVHVLLLGGKSADITSSGSQYGSVLHATEPGSGGGGSNAGAGGSHITFNAGEVSQQHHYCNKDERSHRKRGLL